VLRTAATVADGNQRIAGSDVIRGVNAEPGADAVEIALARALEAAVSAGRLEDVAAIIRELEARRRARTAHNVVDLASSGGGGSP
jgi:hypothetical protein